MSDILDILPIAAALAVGVFTGWLCCMSKIQTWIDRSSLPESEKRIVKRILGIPIAEDEQ